MDRRRLMALTDSDVKARVEERGRNVLASSPGDCSRFLASKIDQWVRVIRADGVMADG